MRRSYAIYQHMVTRLNGPPFQVEVPFTLDDLRHKIAAAIGQPCLYCGAGLNGQTFSADHMKPLNRADEIVTIGWLARLDNVAICCSSCQRLKGCMDADQYRRFLSVLAEFDDVARRDVVRRMKAGGAVFRCGIARI